MHYTHIKFQHLCVAMSLLNFGCGQQKLAGDFTNNSNMDNQVTTRSEPSDTPPNGPPPVIYNAIVGGDMGLVSELISRENINRPVSTGEHLIDMTPLAIAVCHPSVSATMVQGLIDHGALVNMHTGGGFTLLMYALNLRRHAVAEVLIRNQADLYAVNDMGESIMQYAALSNDMISLQHLIDHGVSMYSTNNAGHTPLYYVYT